MESRRESFDWRIILTGMVLAALGFVGSTWLVMSWQPDDAEPLTPKGVLVGFGLGALVLLWGWFWKIAGDCRVIDSTRQGLGLMIVMLAMVEMTDHGFPGPTAVIGLIMAYTVVGVIMLLNGLGWSEQPAHLGRS